MKKEKRRIYEIHRVEKEVSRIDKRIDDYDWLLLLMNGEEGENGYNIVKVVGHISSELLHEVNERGSYGWNQTINKNTVSGIYILAAEVEKPEDMSSEEFEAADARQLRRVYDGKMLPHEWSHTPLEIRDEEFIFEKHDDGLRLRTTNFDIIGEYSSFYEDTTYVRDTFVDDGDDFDSFCKYLVSNIVYDFNLNENFIVDENIEEAYRKTIENSGIW